MTNRVIADLVSISGPRCERKVRFMYVLSTCAIGKNTDTFSSIAVLFFSVTVGT